MKGFFHKLIPLLLLVAGIAVSILFARELAGWNAKSARALGFPVLTILMGIALVLPVVPALLFNQIRVLFICLLLGAVHFLTGQGDGALSDSGRVFLTPLVMLLIVFLTYMRERGLFNRFGLARFLFIAIPVVALALLDHYWPAAFSWYAKLPAWTRTAIPYTNTPMITAAVLIVCWFALRRLRGTEYPLLTPSLFAVILSVAAAADGRLAILRYTAPMAAGVIMIWAMYRLSWGRAYQDALTGLPGRRALEEHMAKLSGHYALAMMDIDHFKKFNDTYGHDTGDDVLKLVASILAKTAPGSAYRYGGEEFTIVAPGRSSGQLADQLEDTREAIAQARLTLRKDRNKASRKKGSGQVSVTASFGTAQPEGHQHPAQVLTSADKALYKAKKSGRNRIKKG